MELWLILITLVLSILYLIIDMSLPYQKIVRRQKRYLKKRYGHNSRHFDLLLYSFVIVVLFVMLILKLVL